MTTESRGAAAPGADGSPLARRIAEALNERGLYAEWDADDIGDILDSLGLTVERTVDYDDLVFRASVAEAALRRMVFEYLGDYRSFDDHMYTSSDQPQTAVEQGADAVKTLDAADKATAERLAAEAEAEGDKGVRTMYARLARAYEEEPTVPNRNGGAPGDLYEL